MAPLLIVHQKGKTIQEWKVGFSLGITGIGFKPLVKSKASRSRLGFALIPGFNEPQRQVVRQIIITSHVGAGCTIERCPKPISGQQEEHLVIFGQSGACLRKFAGGKPESHGNFHRG